MSVKKIVKQIEDIDKQREELSKQIPQLVFHESSGASKKAIFVPGGLNINYYSEQTGRNTSHLNWDEVVMLKNFLNKHLEEEQ